MPFFGQQNVWQMHDRLVAAHASKPGGDVLLVAHEVAEHRFAARLGTGLFSHGPRGDDICVSVSVPNLCEHPYVASSYYACHYQPHKTLLSHFPPARVGSKKVQLAYHATHDEQFDLFGLLGSRLPTLTPAGVLTGGSPITDLIFIRVRPAANRELHPRHPLHEHPRDLDDAFVPSADQTGVGLDIHADTNNMLARGLVRDRAAEEAEAAEAVLRHQVPLPFPPGPVFRFLYVCLSYVLGE
jgi:hypothetical protein